MSLQPLTEWAMIGDVITLGSDKGTFLSADIDGMVMWATIDKGWTPPAPFNFENCLWRICERLSYVEQEMAQIKKRRNSTDGVELALAIEAMDLEAERNLQYLETTPGHEVFYGRVIQLQHVATGKFLSAKNAAALVDSDCLAIQLDPGSSDSYFRYDT